MKTLTKTLLSGLAALSMGAAAIGAQAQTQTPAQNQATAQNAVRPHLTPEQRQAKMAEFAARREAKLHADLGITAGQESAWQSFVAAMKPAANGQRGQFDRAAWTGLSAPQRMQKMIDMQKQRTTRMEQQLSALNSFYSVLSPQQKQVFDTESAQLGRHHFGHGQGGHGGHGNWQRAGQTAQG
ncbi:Spy/CpxP family protein refolding chaperone [Massilia sp. 9096]|uniref:Spy/CpxP family protein refolding chaperone n=1 Tax=Massilia sp. 9096 TaxID=1500894 RepID=UPI00068BD1C2|nr:Spy/CpxP family protein refolding chaperone [Massilia sp. 9096]